MSNPLTFVMTNYNAKDYIEAINKDCGIIWVPNKMMELLKGNTKQFVPIYLSMVIATNKDKVKMTLKEIASNSNQCIKATRLALGTLRRNKLVDKELGCRKSGVPDHYSLHYLSKSGENLFPVPTLIMNEDLLTAERAVLLYLYYLAYTRTTKTTKTADMDAFFLTGLEDKFGWNRTYIFQIIKELENKRYIIKNEHVITIKNVAPASEVICGFVKSNTNECKTISECKDDMTDWYGNGQNYMNNALYKVLYPKFEKMGLYLYPETKIPGCQYKSTLRFDFSVCKEKQDNPHVPKFEDIVANIEYNGAQHFYSTHQRYRDNEGDGFFEQISRDHIKKMWCIEHNIPFVENNIQGGSFVNIIAQQIFDEVVLYSKKQMAV